MKKISLAAGMVVLAVLASIFAGCGSNSMPLKTEETPSTAAAAATSSTVSQPATEIAAATQVPAATGAPVAAETPTEKQDQTAAQTTSGPQNVSAQITVDDAKKVALANAGLQESDVVYKQTVLDTDDAVVKYEIDFYASGKEYEYDIDAATGDVLSAETDDMDAEDYAEFDALTGNMSEKSAAVEDSITEDGAYEIALKDAGISKNDVTSYKVEQDYDDDTGLTKYDVEFHAGAKEYSYEIDMTTGEIYESEVEVDD